MKIRKTACGLVAGALSFGLLVSPCSGKNRVTTKVDHLFAPWDRADSPGAALVIVRDGAVVYRHGYGCANLEQGIPITPHTVFDAASVAKQFTGLAVAMLAEQGKLLLDADIRTYLPEVPGFGAPITVRQLLHHTSGLRDWSEAFDMLGLAPGDLITMDTIQEFVRCQRELDFPPGDHYSYSNTGYNLLAAAVEKVTGQSLRAWMEANLFRPLGMKRTHVSDNPAEAVSNRADSYAADGKGAFRRVVSQLSAPGSSSLLITADDLARWLLNFETARVGGKAAIQAMHQPGKSDWGTNIPYGFGVGLKEYHGTAKVVHTGLWAGYRSVVMRIPEKRLGIAILANAANMVPSDLASQIADLYLGAAVTPTPASAPARPSAAANADPAAWDACLGTYRLGPGRLLTVTREGDVLMAQVTRENKFKMTPLSETNFFAEGYGAAIEFARERSGPVTHLVYRGARAPKLNPPPSTPEQVAAYAGDYWSEELRAVYRLEIRDGHLAAWLRFPGWIRLLPTATDRFDMETEYAIEFTRNPASQVTGLKITGERVCNLRFTRVSLPKPEPVNR